MATLFHLNYSQKYTQDKVEPKKHGSSDGRADEARLKGLEFEYRLDPMMAV